MQFSIEIEIKIIFFEFFFRLNEIFFTFGQIKLNHMKNFMKKIALVAIAFIAFSCSTDEELERTPPLSVLAVAKATPNLSLFVRALEITDLSATFDQSGNYTVFVPDNAAFLDLLSTLGEPNLEALDETLLSNVLKYHVLTTRVLSTDLSNGVSPATLFGQNITVNIDTTADEVTITDGNTLTSDATVIARDINCSNGVIHRIDAVMLPNLGN